MLRVTLSDGTSFEAEDEESILDAALRNGIVLEHSCKTGRCGVCRAKVKMGSTQVLREEEGLAAEDVAAGFVLTCCRTVTSDLVIDADDISILSGIASKTLPCRIDTLELVSPDVMRVRLRLPPNAGFVYLGGQYLDVIWKDGIRRSYSIANANDKSGRIELHIRNVLGGIMSQYWFEMAKENDLLRIEGPKGSFCLRGSSLDIVFLATGTGMAPVKAMLESIEENPSVWEGRNISVYWGGRREEDIYFVPAIDGVAVNFVPVLSRADTEWQGRRGYVQNALIEDIANFQDVAVYACGSEKMIGAAKEMLVGRGLPERRFYSDAFVSSN